MNKLKIIEFTYADRVSHSKELNIEDPYEPWRSIKKYGHEIAVSICLLLFCTAVFSPLVLADEPIPVQTQLLSELIMYPESSAAAQVLSLNDASIAAQVDGLVADILVRVGDRVKIGDALVKLACNDLELELKRLLAEQQATTARMELAQWHLKQSELLAAEQTLPEEQVQEKRSQLTVLRGEQAAHAARIEITQRQIAHCTVKAPFAGVVTARLTAVGQFVSRGTALVHLLDLSRAEVSAQVSSREIIALQQAGLLTFERDNHRYSLHIHAVLPSIQTQTGTQDVRLDFSRESDAPGSAGRLVWQAKQAHIAAEFLVKRNEQWGVFIESNGVAHFKALADAQNGRPAAIALDPGTPVIVSGQFNLIEGSKVKAQARTESHANTKAKP